MYCLIQFYVQLRTPLAEHSPFLKVLAIKLVIFLSFWQSAAISVGTSTLDIVHPNKVLAYPDIKVGIPSLLLCFEMAIFAILHIWAFPYRPYLDNSKTTFYPVPNETLGGRPRENEHIPRAGGPIGLYALWDAMNLWDIVKAFGRGIRWLFVGVKHRHQDPSYHPALGKHSAAGESAVSMSDLGPSGKIRKDGIDTSYPGGRLGARSTDHLPIASEFRRSRYGISDNYSIDEGAAATSDGGPGHHLGPYDRVAKEEHAGLIAHAQPEPHSPGPLAVAPSRRDDEYEYDDDGARHDFTPYGNAAASLSTVEEEPYGRAGSGNPRNSTQAHVGAALWGARNPQGGGGGPR